MLIKSTIIYLLSSLIEKGIMFILIPIYTRYLTVSEYGEYSLILSILSILVILFTLSLSGSASRFHFDGDENYEKLHYGNIYGLVLLISFTLIILSIIFVKIFETDLKNIFIYNYFYQIVSISLLASIFQIHLQKLQMEYKAFSYGLLSILKSIITTLISIILLVYFNLKIEAILFAMIIGLLSVDIYILYYLIKNNYKLNLNKKLSKKNINYSKNLILHNLSSIAMQFIDKFFITYLVNISQTGIYSLGAQVTIILSIINTSINKSLVPKTLESFKSKNYSYLINLATITILITILFSILLSLFGPELILLIAPILYKDSWTVIPFLSFYFVFQMYYYRIAGILFFKEEATKYISLTTLISLILNIILNYTFIKAWGIKGAAIASLISMAIVNYIVIYISSKYIKISFAHYKIHFYIIVGFIISNINFIYYFQILEKIIIFFLTICFYLFMEYKNPLLNNLIKKVIK
jgi:O-antigen/teichoic acid export membrane protein